MTTSQAKASQKYLEKFQDIKIRVPMGEREKIKAYAESQDLSLNAYINKLISEDMNAHQSIEQDD